MNVVEGVFLKGKLGSGKALLAGHEAGGEGHVLESRSVRCSGSGSVCIGAAPRRGAGGDSRGLDGLLLSGDDGEQSRFLGLMVGVSAGRGFSDRTVRGGPGDDERISLEEFRRSRIRGKGERGGLLGGEASRLDVQLVLANGVGGTAELSSGTVRSSSC